jgi:hypothetical protein
MPFVLHVYGTWTRDKIRTEFRGTSGDEARSAKRGENGRILILCNSWQTLWGNYVSMNEMGEPCGSFERY